MKRSEILSVLAAVLLSPSAAVAEDPAAVPAASEVIAGDSTPAVSEAPAPAAPDPAIAVPSEATAATDPAAEDLQWDQFDDPAFDPSVQTDTETVMTESESMAPVETEAAPEGITLDEGASVEVASGIVLGPEGIDDEGRKGRLHTVATGDTLWDLSAAYLGTPWVWPSVWIDNADISNPHLILPGDRIWITANEMRVVSAAEAESFLEPRAEENLDVAVAVEMEPMEMLDEDVPPLAALDGSEEDLSTLDAFPIAVPGQGPAAMAPSRQITVSHREAMGFVSEKIISGAASIVDSPSERTFLAEGDRVILGMGEGDVEVGDHFTIFKEVEDVRDIETNRLLGHHVNVLGWVEVKELTGDTSIAEIRMSYSLIERGDRVMSRPDPSRRVTVRETPDAIGGKVIYLPSQRTVMADGGYVYLNRGEFHGVEIGSQLEVFDAGEVRNEDARGVDVRTPDHRVATLVVVTVEEESSVAFVLSAQRELVVGDEVRPMMERLALR